MSKEDCRCEYKLSCWLATRLDVSVFVFWSPTDTLKLCRLNNKVPKQQKLVCLQPCQGRGEEGGERWKENLPGLSFIPIAAYPPSCLLTLVTAASGANDWAEKGKVSLVSPSCFPAPCMAVARETRWTEEENKKAFLWKCPMLSNTGRDFLNSHPHGSVSSSGYRGGGGGDPEGWRTINYFSLCQISCLNTCYKTWAKQAWSGERFFRLFSPSGMAGCWLKLCYITSATGVQLET